ncbi:MAG: hypothetical protein ACJ786_10505 [Catenulispora sp.]
MSSAGEPPEDWTGGGTDQASAAADAAVAAGTTAAAGTATPAYPTADPGTVGHAPSGRARLRALTGGLADADRPAAEPITAGDGSNAPSADSADFRVRCPDCGPQYVAIADVRFVSTGGADSDRYLFTCPACGARIRRPAGPELAEILRTSGVATLALHRGPGQAL